MIAYLNDNFSPHENLNLHEYSPARQFTEFMARLKGKYFLLRLKKEFELNNRVKSFYFHLPQSDSIINHDNGTKSAMPIKGPILHSNKQSYFGELLK